LAQVVTHVSAVPRLENMSRFALLRDEADSSGEECMVEVASTAASSFDVPSGCQPGDHVVDNSENTKLQISRSYSDCRCCSCWSGENTKHRVNTNTTLDSSAEVHCERRTEAQTSIGQGKGKSMMEVKSKGAMKGKGLGKAEGKGRIQRQTVLVLEDGVEVLEGFPLRGAVLGRGGENFKAICEATGVRLWLIGSGAGREDSSSEHQGPMRIVISSDETQALAEAVELANDLVQSVRDGIRERRQRREQHASTPCSEARGNGRSGPGSKGQNGKGMVSRFIREEKEKVAKQIEETSKRAEELQRDVKEKRQILREKQAALGKVLEKQWMTDEVLEARQAAVALRGSAEMRLHAAQQFWDALERSRAEVPSSHAASIRQATCAASREASAAAKEAADLQKQVKQLKMANSLIGLKRSTGRCCALFANGSCPFQAGQCPRGSHQKPDAPNESEVFGRVTKAKLRLMQQKWSDAGARGQLVNAWQVRNPRLEFLFRGAEANFLEANGHMSDVIDAWHGSMEGNIVSIAINGFDPKRRSGQVYGAGEYFAKDPNVSISYAAGGSFMFLCKLLLGTENLDHTWAAGPRYYVIKQRENRTQVLPIFLVQFQASSSAFYQRLTKELALMRDVEEPGTLALQQRGGLCACEARRDAGMVAEITQHLWLGWLSPSLRFKDNDGIAEDVSEFLEGVVVKQVVPERNGARVGAFVFLEEPISKAKFQELSKRKYRGEWTISVDDAQPGNPKCAGKPCPRLSGPSRFCRGWNIRGHSAWHWGCPFAHPEDLRPTADAEVCLETIKPGSAKFDEIQTELRRSMPHARIVKIQRSQNAALERMYDERRTFIHEKQGFAVEKELWHGTSVDAIPTLLKHGLQPPADTVAADSCPVSGKKGLCTTLCSTECEHCVQSHGWGKCHMYGLGVYLADIAQKSHQYVRCSGSSTYSMLRCRVCLGNPYLIEGNLLSSSAMHDMCWCQDPSEFLESLAEDWSIAKGHDSYYVKGQTGSQKHGLGVYNNEYIVFQPYQILPLYRVDYTL